MIMETAYVQRICLINQERVYASFRVESFSNFYNQSIIFFISKHNSRNKMIVLEIYRFVVQIVQKCVSFLLIFDSLTIIIKGSLPHAIILISIFYTSNCLKLYSFCKAGAFSSSFSLRKLLWPKHVHVFKYIN